MKFITNKINIQAQSSGGFFSDLMKGLAMNAGILRPGNAATQDSRTVPRYNQSVPQPNFPNMPQVPNQASTAAIQQSTALPSAKVTPQLPTSGVQTPAASSGSPAAPASGGAAALPAAPAALPSAKSPIITPPPTTKSPLALPPAAAVSLTPEQQRISQDIQQQIKSLTPDKLQALRDYISRKPI